MEGELKILAQDIYKEMLKSTEDKKLIFFFEKNKLVAITDDEVNHKEVDSVNESIVLYLIISTSKDTLIDLQNPTCRQVYTRLSSE